MADAGADLGGVARSYLDTHDLYKQNECRNSLLLSVSKSNGSSFIAILSEFYDKEDGPAERKKILQLFYEVVSRTEGVFGAAEALDFLEKCAKLTICVQQSVSAAKSLTERHLREDSEADCQRLAAFYELLLSKKISQYPQQCRMDFLALSSQVVDSFLAGRIARVDVPRVCEAVAGEKDPRNLLRMFDLLARLAREVAAEESDFRQISETYAIYYPIQFVPPKRDRIQITPLQLKKALLACFTAHERLAPYSMELLLDSLYSEFAVHEQHLAGMSDTLYYLGRCRPVYGRSFGAFAKQLLEVIKVELLEDAEAGSAEHAAGTAKPGGQEEAPVNGEAEPERASDEEGVSRGLGCLVLGQGEGGPESLVTPKPAHKLEVERVGADCEDGGQPDLAEVRRVGALHRREWRYVDEKVRLYGEILRLFLEDLARVEEQELVAFLEAVERRLHSNLAVTYILDLLCEEPRLHTPIVARVVLPLLRACTGGTGRDLKNANEIVTVLGIFVLPRMLERCATPLLDDGLLTCLMGLTMGSGQEPAQEGGWNRSRFLNLLLLASCITDSGTVNRLVGCIISWLFKSHPELDLSGGDLVPGSQCYTPPVVEHTPRDQQQYLDMMVSVYRCQPGRSGEITRLLLALMNRGDAVPDSEFTSFIDSISQLPGSGGTMEISLPLAEIFKVALLRSSAVEIDVFAADLARAVFHTAMRCLEHIVALFRHDPNSLSWATNPTKALERCMTYAGLLSSGLEAGSRSLFKEAVDAERALSCFKDLLRQYKELVCSQEALHQRVLRFMIGVPKMLSLVADVLGQELAGDTDYRFRYLDLYFKARHVASEHACDPALELSLGSDSLDCNSLALQLLNIESEFISSPGCNDARSLFHFKHINGCVIVSWVQSRFKYDFKDIQKRIKALKDHRVSDSGYWSLFLFGLPLSLDRVPPLVKAQVLDLRKQFILGRLPGQEKAVSDGSGGSENRPEDQAAAREFILGKLYEMLSLESHGIVPAYDTTHLKQAFSKVELSLAFLALMLHGGTQEIEFKHFKLVMEQKARILSAIFESRDGGAAGSAEPVGAVQEGPVSVREYLDWSCDKYLLHLQALIFLVLSNVNASRYPPELGEGVRGLFSGNLEALVEEQVQIYGRSRVPFFRILAILTIHGLITSKTIGMSPALRRQVVKRCSHFLGDANRKVRAIAVSYREQWMASLEG